MKTKFFRTDASPANGTVNERTRRFASTACWYCLLLLFLYPVELSAQNGVSMTNFTVSGGTVTFNVSWDRNAMPVALWNDTVWVFVDYNAGGTMKRLPLLSGATLTAHTAPAGVGRVEQIPGNNKGVWVVGNAKSETNTSGSFSATVKLLTATANVAGACLYASNYPPVGEYTAANVISFTGTPMYNIIIEDGGGNTESRTSGSPFTVPNGYTVQSFTDETGAPGILIYSTPAAPAVTPGARCGAGTITLYASSAGAEIDWYDAATGGTLLWTGNTFTTPTITASTTYYAQARYTATGYVSAKVPVTATVNLHEGMIGGRED